MDIEGNANRDESSNEPSEIDSTTQMRTLIRMIVELKEQRALMQQQIDFLRDALSTAQQAATAAVAAALKATASQEPRIGSIVDFKELNPKTFSGTESPLEAEQWITDMVTLLDALNVPEADRLKMVKIQLTDVARSWWIVEEARLQTPSTWKQFADGFLEQFFPRSARKDLEEKFINLKQGNRPVDEYAVEFYRLQRFAPYMVETEEALAHRFQQGLKVDIQKYLENSQLKTYSQILTAARGLERLQGKKDESEAKTTPKSRKRPLHQDQRQQRKEVPTSKRASRQPSSPVVCSYCQRPGHKKKNCWKKNKTCLICGSREHRIASCPRKRPDPRDSPPAPPTFPTSPIEAVPLQMIPPEFPMDYEYQQYHDGSNEFPRTASESASAPAWVTDDVETGTI